MKNFILVCIFLAMIMTKPLDPQKVIWAVNSGTNVDLISPSGILYKKDHNFVGGKISDYNEHPELSLVQIKYTKDQQLYKTERHDDFSFSYKIKIPQAGNYVLILKFCELWFKDVNKRQFNVKLGETYLLKNFDVVSIVGPHAAYDEYLPITVSDDGVYFKGQNCRNAFDKKTQEITIEFEKTSLDNPKIEGIVLYEGMLEDTDYYEVQDELKQIIRANQQDIKAKQELVNRRQAIKSLLKGLDNYNEQNETYLYAFKRILQEPSGMILVSVFFSFLCFQIAIGGNEDHVTFILNQKIKQ